MRNTPVSRKIRSGLSRIGAAFGACGLFLALATAPAAASPLPVAPAADSATDPLAEFGTCMSASGTGSIVLLVDQSGSMYNTDPNKDRITAGTHLISRLADLGARASLQIDMRVAGFAAQYEARSEWMPVDAGSEQVLTSALTQLGDDLRNYDTDYWMALEGARRDLEEHAGDDACKAIVWITDGDYEIDHRDDPSDPHAPIGSEKPYAGGRTPSDSAAAAEILAAGKTELCRDTGLADQIRSSKITLLGIGLTQGSPDFSFVNGVIKGGGSNASANGVNQCGSVSTYPGEFFAVNDFDALLIAIDAIAEGNSPDPVDVPVCQGKQCDQVLDFVLDDSLDRVHIMASANKAGLDAFLLPPGATEPIAMGAADTSQVAGVDFSWHQTTGQDAKTLEINLESVDPSQWAGQWKLGFIDTTSSSSGEAVKVYLYLSSTSLIDWTNKADLDMVTGEKVSDLTLVALDEPGGSPIDLNKLPGEVEVEVSMTDARGTKTTVLKSSDKAVLDAPIEVDLSDAAVGPAQLDTVLRITTAKITTPSGETIPGTALLPSSTRHSFTVVLPDEFPALLGEADFGLLEDQTAAKAEVEVSGPGCVWVNTEKVTFSGAPADAGTITVTSPAASAEQCVTIAEGATGVLALDLTVERPSNAALRGQVTVMLAPEGKPEAAVEADLPFKAEMRKPLNVSLAIGTFVIALVLGIGLPVLLLYLFKFLTSRIPAGDLTRAIFEVEVPEGGVMPPIRVPKDAWVVDRVHKAARRFEVGPYTLRARMGLSPATVGWVELDNPAPSISGARPGARGSKARLPLSVRGNWIAVLDKPEGPSKVTLIILASSADAAIQGAILDKAAEQLPAAVKRAAEHLPEPQQSTGTQGTSFGPNPQGAQFGPNPGGTQTGAGFFPASAPAPSFGYPSSGSPQPQQAPPQGSPQPQQASPSSGFMPPHQPPGQSGFAPPSAGSSPYGPPPTSFGP